MSGVNAVQVSLAAILSGHRPAPVSIPATFDSNKGPLTATITMDLLWNGVDVSIDCDDDAGFSPTLDKFADTFNPENQDALKGATRKDLLELDARLKTLNTSCSDLRSGLAPISLPVAQMLIEFHTSSINRVIHEELAGFMTRTVRDKAARLLLGRFLLTQFPLPSKRTHRFVICQALENLAEPELFEGLSNLVLDKRHTSLRGCLCEAIARTKHPDAAQTIAAVLDDCDDETKLSAIEAIGILKAKQFADRVRVFTNYQSSDKEWTRAIRKAAEKAMKTLY